MPGDLGGEHAACVDDDLALDVAAVGADLGHTALAVADVDGVDRGDSGVGADRDPPCRARAASAIQSWDGSSWPSDSRMHAPSTPSVDMSGNMSRASAAEISWSGRS